MNPCFLSKPKRLRISLLIPQTNKSRFGSDVAKNQTISYSLIRSAAALGIHKYEWLCIELNSEETEQKNEQTPNRPGGKTNMAVGWASKPVFNTQVGISTCLIVKFKNLFVKYLAVYELSAYLKGS